LVVYSNRELSSAVTLERFEPVARQCRQIGQASRGLKPVEPQFSLPGKTRKLPDMPSGGKSFRCLVSVADDHGAITNNNYGLRKQ